MRFYIFFIVAESDCFPSLVECVCVYVHVHICACMHVCLCVCASVCQGCLSIFHVIYTSYIFTMLPEEERARLAEEEKRKKKEEKLLAVERQKLENEVSEKTFH